MENDTFTLLTFNFNKETFTKTFVEQEHDVCRNLMSGVVELSSIFGFTTPLTSGIWSQKDGDEFKEMLYGAVDISEMKSGSLYTFRYNVNSAIDALCLVEGSSTEFHLRMHDLSVANAEAKICKAQLKQGVTIDLSSYVPGLNDTNRISPRKVTWHDTTGKVINNPDRYTLKASAEWQTADTSTYKIRYQYEVKSDCGPYTGSLYISTIDSIGSDTLRKVVVCYTDDYAKHIDLYQVLGIVGASGSFTLCNDPVNERGRKIDVNPDVIEEIQLSGVMNAFGLFTRTNESGTNESETYTFCYLPGKDDTCLQKKQMEITIIVTKNIQENSTFKEN
jgi:hypothetical protein